MNYFKSVVKSLVSELWKWSFQDYFGSIQKIRRHMQDRHMQNKGEPTLEESINVIKERWPYIKTNSDSQPLFIFASGWRSGSTLLQRLLVSSGKIIIWGEPYEPNELIQNLAMPLRGITNEFPNSSWFISDKSKDIHRLSQRYIANLYPEIDCLINSQINFLLNLFEKYALEKGFSRWGLKAVRLDIDHAIYLNWLFPKSKFIFLYRNPYNAYNSFKGNYWYKKYPGQPVYTAKQFGQNWKNLITGYLNGHKKINSLLLSYEDICSDKFDFEQLSEFCNLDIDKSIIERKMDSTATKSAYKNQTKELINSREINILKKVVEPIASELGYDKLL